MAVTIVWTITDAQALTIREALAHHQGVERQICTECHDPHSGSTRNLLKAQLPLEDSSSLTDVDK